MTGSIESRITERDYTQLGDVVAGIDRLVSGLRADGDDSGMFESLGGALDQDPEAVMQVVRGSIALARDQLGQDRRRGSSATLLYPIVAAAQVTAIQKECAPAGDPFSAADWSAERVLCVLQQWPDEVIELAGSQTTSKNIPQRAAAVLELLRRANVAAGQSFAVVEIGASGGLLLDALKQPRQFLGWMATKGYQFDSLLPEAQAQENAVLGIDLVRPPINWLQAVILDDSLRQEVKDFIGEFDRSPVIVGDAVELDTMPEVAAFFDGAPDAVPVVLSCCMLYQLDESLRQQVISAAQRALGTRPAGGLIVEIDIAKNYGYDLPGGYVGLVKDDTGNVVCQKLLFSGPTLTDWRKID